MRFTEISVKSNLPKKSNIQPARTKSQRREFC